MRSTVLVRRRACRVTALVVAGLLLPVSAGCSPAATPDVVGDWWREQATVLAVTDVPGSGSLAVELEPDTPDAEVGDLARRWRPDAEVEAAGRPTVELDVDGFLGLLGAHDDARAPGLERALWLRADGRAASYARPAGSAAGADPVVTAATTQVAQLAVDLDAAVVAPEEGERVHTVVSADGAAGVRWNTDEDATPVLTGSAVSELADLQTRYPGTTGWVDAGSDPGVVGRVSFSPADVGLDVVAGGLVDRGYFEELMLEWGPARAPAGRFARVWEQPRAQRLLELFAGVPGVVGLEPDTVAIGNRSAYDAVAAPARRLALTIEVQHARRLFDPQVEPVAESPPFSGGVLDPLVRTVAGLPDVVSADVVPGGEMANLVVDPAIDDASLREVLQAYAALPGWYERTEVGVEVRLGATEPGYARLGVATEDGFTSQARDADAALAERVDAAWRSVLAADRGNNRSPD